MNTMRSRALWLGLTCALFITGCGDITAGGAEHGEGRASVAGDDPSAGAMAGATSPALAPSGSGVVEAQGPIQGDVLVTLRIELLHEDGTTAELTGGQRAMVLQADGSNTISLDPVQIPTGAYDGVRVTFYSVEADVRTGLPFVGTVKVDFGASSDLVVERDIPFLVNENTRIAVLVNLRSATWLVAATPVLHIVTAAQFRSRVEVEVAPE